MHPTLVSLRGFTTDSVAFEFSLHSHLTERALGCFHPNAFPTSLHSLDALHSVKRWWRVCFFPPAPVVRSLVDLVPEVRPDGGMA